MIILARALKWPIFIFAVLLLYWSVVYVSLTGHLKWLKFKGKRNDVLAWAEGMKAFFKFKVLKVGSQELHRGKGMYLCNHRSWADFMVDQFVTEGRSLFMSRRAVAAVFPTFLLTLEVMRSVILFKRGSIADKEGFNRWLDWKLESSPQQALAVYPEGHRSTHGESLPLKRGMLNYAYRRRLPCQIVIGANKEAILSERHHTARLNQTVAVGFSEVIYPEQCGTFDDFMGKVQKTWDSHWDTVFDANWAELEEMPAPRIDNEYPLWMALRMLGALLVNWAFFALCTYYTYRFCCAVLALFGPLQPVVASLAVLYIAGSFLTYRHPVLALQVHQQRAPSLVASRMENDLSNGQREESAAQPAVKKES